MTNKEIIQNIHPDFYNKRAHVRRRVLLGFEVEEAMNAARNDERKPPFIVAEVREYLNELLNEDITFSRFVELLNTRPKMQKP